MAGLARHGLVWLLVLLAGTATLSGLQEGLTGKADTMGTRAWPVLAFEPPDALLDGSSVELPRPMMLQPPPRRPQG